MTDRRAVVVIGPPAAGKTVTGAALARLLDYDFVDTDAVIAEEAGISIPEIFAQHGEPDFRARERDVIARHLRPRTVLSLGGGAVTIPEVAQMVAEHRVVLLTLGLDEAVRRIGSGASRPLLADDVASRWSALVAAREQIYQSLAHLTVPTDGHSPEEVARMILAQLHPDHADTHPNTQE